MMKHTNTIWIMAMLMILMSSLASAEIVESAHSYLDSDSMTYSKYTYIHYPFEDRFLDTTAFGSFAGRNVRLTIQLGCDDLGNFNSANPDYTIRNVSLKTTYIKKLRINQSTGLSLIEPTYETIERDYGCADDSPSCDITNTIFSTQTPSWWEQLKCLLDVTTCPSTISSDRRIDFNLIDGESLTLNMVTYFNGTAIQDDSFCSYGLSLNSENCRGCAGKDYEETINALDTRETTFQQKSEIIGFVDTLVTKNYQIWGIVYYIVAIGVLIFAIVGLIYIIFWLYYLVRDNFGTDRRR